MVRQSIKRKIAAHLGERPMKISCDSIDRWSYRAYDDIINFNKCAVRKKLRGGRPTLPNPYVEIIEMLETIILSSSDIFGARVVKKVTKYICCFVSYRFILATSSSLMEHLNTHRNTFINYTLFTFTKMNFILKLINNIDFVTI